MNRLRGIWLLFSCFSGLVLGLPNCDFEKRSGRWCGWTQALDDEYQWKARQYPTFAVNTGPQGDHTTGTGYYIFTDSRDAEAEGWTTRLISPVIEGSYDIPTTVVTFWYSMWDELGTSMGTLNVYIMFGDKMDTTPVWSRSGPRTKKGEWKEARIPLYSAGPFQIVFEGIRGPGAASDIGIDDISFTQAPLPEGCDFEGSDFGPLCGFYQEDETDDFDWTLNSGETPSLDTGPLTDNTYLNDSGHYLFIETTRPDEEQTAHLKSFEYFKQPGRCTLEFYYHAFGPDIGGLDVYIQGVKTDFRIIRSQDSWNRARIDMTDIAGRYTIGFTGFRGDGNLGDIAIDDIRIFGGSCFDVDVCGSNPCQNGGMCLINGDRFMCNCTTGWTGTQCDLSIDECWSSPCSEPFVCVDRVDGYECRCPEGLKGENCKEAVTQEPPIKEPSRGIPPEKVVVILTAVVAVCVALVTAIGMTVYCTRSGDKDEQIDGGGTYQMNDVLEGLEESGGKENVAFENKMH